MHTLISTSICLSSPPPLRYEFNGDKLKLAHDECYQSAKQAAISDVPMIIIDNTNIQAWNYRGYVSLSRRHHYTPLIIEPQTPWAKDPHQLALKNTHGITQEHLEKRVSEENETSMYVKDIMP